MHRYPTTALDILKRRHYGRLNFLCAALGGSYQWRRKTTAKLFKDGHLRRHSPHGDGDPRNVYQPYFHRIYSLRSRKDKFNWHRVGVDDLGLSFEAACSKHGIRMRFQDELLQSKPFQLSASIEHTFGKVNETYAQPLKPDDLFALNELHVVLEHDTGSETNEPQTFRNIKSTLRSLLQYRDVLKNRIYNKEWGFENLIVIMHFDNPTRKRHAMELMQKLNIKSRSMLFCSFPTLTSTIVSPKPILSILTHEFERVGHPPFVFVNELQKGGDSIGRSTHP